VLCRDAIRLVEAGAAPEAAASEALFGMQGAIQNEEGEPATGGLIVVDASGQGGWAFTTPRMACGVAGARGKIEADVFSLASG
jgi:beta-aspartyl-peptidase (threonine type)